MLASRVCESSIKDIQSFTFRAYTQFQLCVTTMIYVLYMPFFAAKKISPDVDCLLQFSSNFFFLLITRCMIQRQNQDYYKCLNFCQKCTFNFILLVQ